MAIVSRKRRSGAVVHYVVFSWQGRDVWERSGTDCREAQRLERQRKREVRDGTDVPQLKSGAVTLARCPGPWFEGRKKQAGRHGHHPPRRPRLSPRDGVRMART